MTDQKQVTLCSGEVVEIYEGDNRKDIQEICNWSKDGFVKPVNGNWIMTKDFLDIDVKLFNFEFRSSDIFVNGFPKSGTTWVQEIVWTIMNNLDLTHPLKGEKTFYRVPFFELDMWSQFEGRDWTLENVSKVNNVPIKTLFADMYPDLQNPRIFKTHMYPSVINHKMLDVSKMVYVARDPMDSCFSFYLFHRYLTGFIGLNKDWSEFPDIYIRGELLYGNAVEHIRSWWPYRGNKHLYIIFYEEILKDPAGEIKKLAKFLEKDLTDEQVQTVIQQTSFNTMKKDYSKADEKIGDIVGVKKSDEKYSFFRKGISGDSKNMPKEAFEKLAEFFKNSMKDSDLPYSAKYQ